MKNLQDYGVQELNVTKMENIDGGGWIADAVEAVVRFYKCDCRKTEMHWTNSPMF